MKMIRLILFLLDLLHGVLTNNVYSMARMWVWYMTKDKRLWNDKSNA